MNYIDSVKVYVIDFPVVKVHVDELSSARIWQHKLCATLSANVNIKVYYRICTVRHQNQYNSWKPECVSSFNTKFEQTIIHQHVLLRLESQSHILLRRENQLY
jgi:hypothetical protein